MASLKQPRNIPISSIHPDDEAVGFFGAPGMDIYDRIVTAQIQGLDTGPVMRELAMRPAQDRYVSRIVASLGFAFGDFDSVCIKFDLETLPAADLTRIRAALETRTAQFRLLLQEVFGEERATDLLTRAIRDGAEPTGRQDFGDIPFNNGAPVYYKRDGSPCPYEEWSRLLADKDYAQVASTKLLGGTTVETAWLGVDGRSFYTKPLRIDKHLIFYTKVDLPGRAKKKPSSVFFRYATEQEAREGHEAAVSKYGPEQKQRIGLK